ncbi:hypothetical protein EYF80_000095 [Liparis tanakae]|uniref:Uncharacterized protein n=1 Tax=Liparis tanakae TaxID=230148 RepID=A0A4Z2JJS8_9TELE|nr:hypothetical protein EYF80_000095 [Liparis tanakae]
MPHNIERVSSSISPKPEVRRRVPRCTYLPTHAELRPEDTQSEPGRTYPSARETQTPQISGPSPFGILCLALFPTPTNVPAGFPTGSARMTGCRAQLLFEGCRPFSLKTQGEDAALGHNQKEKIELTLNAALWDGVGTDWAAALGRQRQTGRRMNFDESEREKSLRKSRADGVGRNAEQDPLTTARLVIEMGLGAQPCITRPALLRGCDTSTDPLSRRIRHVMSRTRSCPLSSALYLCSFKENVFLRLCLYSIRTSNTRPTAELHAEKPASCGPRQSPGSNTPDTPPKNHRLPTALPTGNPRPRGRRAPERRIWCARVSPMPRKKNRLDVLVGRDEREVKVEGVGR